MDHRSLPYTRADAVAYVGEVAPAVWEQGGAVFAVVDASTGGLAGSIGAHSVCDGVANVGYWTATAARGRGLTTDALRTLTGWFLRDGGAARLELIVEPANVGSVRVAESAGFTHEGLLRQRLFLRGPERTLPVVHERAVRMVLKHVDDYRSPTTACIAVSGQLERLHVRCYRETDLSPWITAAAEQQRREIRPRPGRRRRDLGVHTGGAGTWRPDARSVWVHCDDEDQQHWVADPPVECIGAQPVDGRSKP